MSTDYSSLLGSEGWFSKSGKTIYDSLHETPEYFLPTVDLEAILRRGLIGLDFNRR